MKLKKFFMVVAMILALAASANAADLSRNALNFRSQVKSYLSSEGYTPSIDEDGDVKFKYNGYTYYIHLMEFDGKIVVRYMVGITLPDELTRGQANSICQYVSQQKICARAILTPSGKTIYVQIDAFCSGITMFKELFAPNMMLLDTVSDNAIDKLQEML